MLLELGVGAIFQRNLALTELLLAGLAERPHLRLLSPVRSQEQRSQVVVVTLGSVEANRELCCRLLEQGIVVANRGDSIRISPNFYNTEEEVQRLLSLL